MHGLIMGFPYPTGKKLCFYAPGSNDQGHIVFVLSVCLFVCLLSTLTFDITFEQ